MTVEAERVAAVRERLASKAQGDDPLATVELTLAAIDQPRSRADRRRWDSLRREARETLRALGYPEALTDLLKRPMS